MDQFDFQDGKGLVPAHRHKNPDGSLGGWVAETAQVSGTAQVYGDARVYGNAWVSGTIQVSGDARVYGNAWVDETAQVSGDARVSGGEWKTSPLYIQGSKYSLTNSKPGFITIGCETLTFKEWLGKEGKLKAKENNFTKEEIEEYTTHIKHIIKLGR